MIKKPELLELLSIKVSEARRKSFSFAPNIYLLVNNDEFIQMVGHKLLGGNIKTPRFQGFRVKVLDNG